MMVLVSLPVMNSVVDDFHFYRIIPNRLSENKYSREEKSPRISGTCLVDVGKELESHSSMTAKILLGYQRNITRVYFLSLVSYTVDSIIRYASIASDTFDGLAALEVPEHLMDKACECIEKHGSSEQFRECQEVKKYRKDLKSSRSLFAAEYWDSLVTGPASVSYLSRVTGSQRCHLRITYELLNMIDELYFKK